MFDIEMGRQHRCNGFAGNCLRLMMLALGLAPVLTLAGCGVGLPKPVVGAVTQSDANGNTLPTPIAIKAGGTAYFLVTVADDDSLGADWVVTCSNALPISDVPAGTLDTSCGSFTPAHTMSGPVPRYEQNGTGYVALYTAPTQIPTAGTVTITAHATALPSRTSSLTLNVTN